MSQTAKIFTNGRSQAVRLPSAFRFDTQEVFVRRDPQSGDVILSSKPDNWDSFFEAAQRTRVPKGFLGKQERKQREEPRDPFKGWEE